MRREVITKAAERNKIVFAKCTIQKFRSCYEKDTQVYFNYDFGTVVSFCVNGLR